MHPPAPWRTGLIYDETRGTRRWVYPSLKDWAIEASQGPKQWKWKYSDEGDGWNDIHVVCRGTRIQTAVNGIPIADFDGAGVLDDGAHRSRRVGLTGHIALQLHVKDDLYIQYKDLRVRPLATAGAGSGPSEALLEGFAHPPADSRVMMRWWWFGPAVEKAELEREMRRMKEGGIGGFEVQPVYPLQLDGNMRFLSDEFLDALRFTSEKAHELGLRMDLTLGSGWPYGGPTVPITEASARLRCDRVAVPAGARELPLPRPGEGEKFIAAFLVKGEPKSFSGEDLRELADVRQNSVLLPAVDGPHTVLFFISSRTKQQVKRAAFGAEGYVFDHYDRAATDHYLHSVGEPLLKPFAAGFLPHAVFCDSLEVYGADWTPDFLEQFKKRRGYDLRPYLPALAGDIGPKTGAIRNDWIATLGELAEENFLTPLHDWANAHRTLLRVQDYGIPPVTLASNARVDLQEGEGSFWNRFTTSRWASSAGHLLGRPVTSSETWTWLHSPAFRATPLDMKAEADRHFLEGINQLVGHGWPYSPESAGKPGWRFYAAAVFNHSNPWWIVMPELTGYMQRLSFLLRHGRPVNDVLLYVPTADARAIGLPSINQALDKLFGPNLVARILEAGFNFDLIDDGLLAHTDLTGRVIVLPNVERIPLETYRKLEAFVRAGGVLVATGRAPLLAPGLMEEKQAAEIREISRRLFERAAALVPDEGALGAKLAALRAPDVAMSPAAPEIGFVHRSTGTEEIYFLANTANSRRGTVASFRVSGLEPEWWDPFTGEAKPAQVESREGGRIAVRLDIEPYGSRVVVFSKHAPAAVEPALAPAVAIDLSTNWKLTFDGLRRTVQLPNLRSWTEDEQTRFYSGTATYEKTFTLPKAATSAWLDFGEGTPVPEVASKQPGMRAWLESPVREAAMVYVNGIRAGAVWHPPYRLEVMPFLHKGENSLRIVAGNLAINALAGGPPPDYTALYRRCGQRFAPQDMDNLRPLASGLLGPVRLELR